MAESRTQGFLLTHKKPILLHDSVQPGTLLTAAA